MRVFRKQSLRIIITDLIVWITAMVIFIIIRFLRFDPGPVQTTELPVDSDYTLFLWLGVQAGAILGLIYGLVDVFLDQAWLRKRSYGSILVIKGAIHLTIIILISALVRLVDKGLHNLNCLMEFFRYLDHLKSNEHYYIKNFGICPEFKAGVNIGEVTVTEVGDIKRDLAFLGDTMNTAARIQDQCSIYKKDLLISEALHKLLPESERLKRSPVGTIELKGKQEATKIYSVEPAG